MGLPSAYNGPILGISLAYLGVISGILFAYLRHILGISQVYLGHISGIRHIKVVSQEVLSRCVVKIVFKIEITSSPNASSMSIFGIF